MADRKEHHFCFAYKGGRLRVTPFETLHFVNVQGTSTLDGFQLVRISLHRKNGRRAASIPNVIQEYNALSGIDPIVPVPMAAQLITCFKTTHLPSDNPILLRIEADRSSSSRYWCWDAAEQTQTVKKPTKKGSFAGLEGLVRELNLDPTVLCMQSAYDQVALAYFQVKGVQLKNSGSFPLKDKEFLLAELKRHFDRERMYVVSPNTHGELTAAAKAITEECLMDDLKFKEDSTNPKETGANAIVCQYFSRMLPQWREARMHVSFKDILAEFNRDNAGMYRRTCILPFMQPLINSGAVEVQDKETLIIHVANAALYFQK